MFLVRVILFMMSRGAQKSAAPVFKPAQGATDQSQRARLQSERETAPDAEGEQGGPITREEMVRLFGNALRVR